MKKITILILIIISVTAYYYIDNSNTVKKKLTSVDELPVSKDKVKLDDDFFDDGSLVTAEVKIVEPLVEKTEEITVEKIEELPVKTKELEMVCHIPVPPGYKRNVYKKNSFGRFLQELKLKKNKEIKTYNGKLINPRHYNRLAVVDMPLLFKRDLEQCADFCMRFFGEYKMEQDKGESLFLFNYSGKKKYMRNSGKNYRKFLNYHMAHSNSHSLKKGCKKIKEEEIQIGDLIVQNETGGIGHVCMIVDECEDKETGDKLFLIGFSFMPAQEFHIEEATAFYGAKGWFSLKGFYKFLSKNFPYGKPKLRRFE